MASRVWVFLLPMVALSVAPAGSHHAFSPVYDASRTVTIEGVVMQFRFVNPHATLLLDVTDKAGKVVTWNIEFAGRLNLEEAGWTAEAIKAGERVTITGNPAWKSTPRLAFVKLTRADGTTLLPGRAQRLEAIEEERRERARRRNQSK